jgi:uncharacterized protein YggU (UPF0235/DUF167 family)
MRYKICHESSLTYRSNQERYAMNAEQNRLEQAREQRRQIVKTEIVDVAEQGGSGAELINSLWNLWSRRPQNISCSLYGDF